MMKQVSKKPERALIGAVLIALAVVACAGDADVTTTTAPSLPGTTTTATTEPDRCPEPFCVVYTIRPDASWSDGTPVTSSDFVHTYEMQEGEDGYSLVTRHSAIDDKTVLFAFSRPYGPWQSLFDVVLPSHVEDPLSVSAGPFALDELGESVELVANPEFNGEEGDVERIHLIPVSSVREGLRRLESGELDMVFPPSLDWVLAELDEMDHVVRHTVSGPIWEQVAFNFDNPHLGELWVREALNLAIDRGPILDATIRTIDPDEVALNSAIWPDAASLYEPVFPEAWNPSLAVEILTDHGCALGEDGVFVCDGERLEFTYATTIGDPWRRSHFEIIRDQLADVGVEVNGLFLAPVDLYSDAFLFGGHEQWDLLGFPWQFSERLHLGNSRFECDGDAPSGYGALNVNRYCSDAVDDLILATETETHTRGRRDLYREIDRLYLWDLAVIPLYQRPITIAWRSSFDGPHVNMSTATHLWSVGTWTGIEEVRIGIEKVPEHLEPLNPGDAALVLAPVSAGAFTVDPSFRFVPDLVESAEIIVREP